MSAEKQRKPIRAKAIFLLVVCIAGWPLSRFALPYRRTDPLDFASPRDVRHRVADAEVRAEIRQRVERAWKRIEAAFKELGPKSLESLNPPATDDEIAALEDYLGFPLPFDLRCSLQIHNGQRPNEPSCFFYTLLSTDEIRKAYDEEATESIREVAWGNGVPDIRDFDWWQPDVLIFADDFGVGFRLVVEIANGRIGEWYEGGALPVSGSFADWLEAKASLAEAGSVDEYRKGYPSTTYQGG